LHFVILPLEKSTTGRYLRKSTIGHFESSKVWDLRKGEETRTRIVEAAAQLAASRGLAAVSLNDVAGAVGLSKSGLFKHFDSKEAMQAALIESEMVRFAETVWAPAEPLAPGRDRLKRIFELWLRRADATFLPAGCLFVSASAELDDQPGALRDLLQAGQRRWQKTLTKEFEALTDPPLPLARAQLAAYQMKSFVLGHNEARRLLEDENALDMAWQAFDALLERAAKD
jgi:AcrR family transcriptional regulator